MNDEFDAHYWSLIQRYMAKTMIMNYEQRKKIKEEINSMNGNGIEKRTYLNFKIGDLVKIRKIEDMIDQYGTKDNMFGSKYINSFGMPYVNEIAQYSEKEYIIKDKVNKELFLKPKGHKEAIRFAVWNDMVEIVEEGYMNRIKAGASKKTEEKVNDDEVIQEMIKKVDKQKLTRIFAGSIDINLKDINGIDNLLQKWAEAKKDLYITLGRNIKIEKEIEYTAAGSEIKILAKELINLFPSAYKILDAIYDSSFERNEYQGEFDCLKQYCPGLTRRNEIIKSL